MTDRGGMEGGIDFLKCRQSTWKAEIRGGKGNNSMFKSFDRIQPEMSMRKMKARTKGSRSFICQQKNA